MPAFVQEQYNRAMGYRNNNDGSLLGDGREMLENLHGHCIGVTYLTSELRFWMLFFPLFNTITLGPDCALPAGTKNFIQALRLSMPRGQRCRDFS